MPDWTLKDELGEIHVKPGLANEDYYSPLDLRRTQRPVEAEHDEHDLDHLEAAEGP